MNDPIGQAIFDYYMHGKAPAIKVSSNYTENEEIIPSWFFREVQDMPKIEQTALRLCRGKILDVGAAAGCHSVPLKNKGFDVTAVEKSALAAEILNKRGIDNIVNTDIFSFTGKGFDTILLLMNGAGIGATVNGLIKLMKHLGSLLTNGGQILLDSTDISYLFREDDGSYWTDIANPGYFGEMLYYTKYKTLETEFKWLFIDRQKMKECAETAGLKFEIADEGKQNEYLARLTKK
ncbi:MAG: SAM-dependent methyltransferase [Draconibacterium sp.]|nr:MAG: SAM-dependent methyltransferase [Draconibacterium sp.]PIF06507.1 MAG: SAM-dependent methyltransferase [Draconibacterium sp.]